MKNLPISFIKWLKAVTPEGSTPYFSACWTTVSPSSHKIWQEKKKPRIIKLFQNLITGSAVEVGRLRKAEKKSRKWGKAKKQKSGGGREEIR